MTIFLLSGHGLFQIFGINCEHIEAYQQHESILVVSNICIMYLKKKKKWFIIFFISLSVTQNDFIPVHSLQWCFVDNLYGGSTCFLIATNMNLGHVYKNICLYKCTARRTTLVLQLFENRLVDWNQSKTSCSLSTSTI